MQDIYIYMDDSGVLHPKEASGVFIYAGYIFVSTKEKDDAKRKYLSALRKISPHTKAAGELKACKLEVKHKRALYNVLRYYESFSVSVDIKRVFPGILENKKSICRYKDYVIKRTIKTKVNQLISQNKISSLQDTTLHLNIDEQLSATNGYYDLSSTIEEEFLHGIYNYNYATFHQPIFACNKLNIHVAYCQSDKNYLIQASDILANKIWNFSRKNLFKIPDIPSHSHLTFP